MPRARLLKPGFFKNVALARLSERHRLLFAGLWTLADRQGRLKDEPLWIRSEVFPYEPEIDVNGLLTDLQLAGFITRYTYGDKYQVADRIHAIAIPAFLTHQTPHHREPESTILAPSSKRARLRTATGKQPKAGPRPASVQPTSSRAVTGDPVTGDPETEAEPGTGDPGTGDPEAEAETVKSSAAKSAARFTVKHGTETGQHLAVITKFAHEAIGLLGPTSSDLAEAIKSQCARYHIPYDSAVVRQAIESAFVQRQRRRES